MQLSISKFKINGSDHQNRNIYFLNTNIFQVAIKIVTNFNLKLVLY